MTYFSNKLTEINTENVIVRQKKKGLVICWSAYKCFYLKIGLQNKQYIKYKNITNTWRFVQCIILQKEIYQKFILFEKTNNCTLK